MLKDIIVDLLTKERRSHRHISHLEAKWHSSLMHKCGEESKCVEDHGPLTQIANGIIHKKRSGCPECYRRFEKFYGPGSY